MWVSIPRVDRDRHEQISAESALPVAERVLLNLGNAGGCEGALEERVEAL